MKTLEAQRARYLKMVEAAGNEDVLVAVQRLETEMTKLDPKRCKEALADNYIRRGVFSYDYAHGVCVTNEVGCPEKDHARIKEYFEQRNPNAFLSCYSVEYHDGADSRCEAYLRPESLFEKNK